MKIETQGRDAINATEELLKIEGLQGSYQTIADIEREATIVTIATIVGIVSGTLTIAEKLYEWNRKYQKPLDNPMGARIEKVMIISEDGRRLLLTNATVEQIREIIE
jgi:hypothetical protein